MKFQGLFLKNNLNFQKNMLYCKKIYGDRTGKLNLMKIFNNSCFYFFFSCFAFYFRKRGGAVVAV